jgi:hypothetical protein
MKDSAIYTIQHNLFTFIILVSYVLITLVYLGWSTSASSYLDIIDYYLRIYVCLFLIWRFNPFRKIEFTELDRKIVFSAGLLLLTTTALNQYITSVATNITSNVANLTSQS